MKSGVQRESRLARAIASSMDPGVVQDDDADDDGTDGVVTVDALRGRPTEGFLRLRGLPRATLLALRHTGCVRCIGVGMGMAGRVTSPVVFVVLTPRDLRCSSVANEIP